jgi:hypothetical protein
MFKYPKSFLFVMLLMVTCNVRAEFAPFSYMTSILSRVVYCCKPQTWGKFLWNRFGTVTRPELDVQVLATQKEINAIYAAGKQSFDKQFDQLKDELVKKLSAASKEFAANLEKVEKHADENINIIQNNIVKLNGLIIAQQKAFEVLVEQQFKDFNEKLQLEGSKFADQFATFERSNTSRRKAFKVTLGNLEKDIESVKDINGQTLQIVDGIQRPLTKEQRTMFKRMPYQFERPILEPSRPMGAAAALRLALPSNYH